MEVGDLLKVRPLTSLLVSFDDESRDNLFTNIFKAGEQVEPPGDEVRWDEVTMPRGLAPITGPESPAKRVDRTALVVKSSPLAFVKEYTDISAHRLYKQRTPGGDTANVEKTLGFELRALKKRIGKTINKMCADSLQGRLLVNNTTYPGSDVALDINYAGNFTALTPSAVWSAVTTLIQSKDLIDFETKILKSSGMKPEIALFNESVEKSLRQNTELQNFTINQRYAGNQVEGNVITPEILSALRLGGLEWLKSIGFFTDGAGTVTNYMADNTAVFIPGQADLDTVLGFAQATTYVPKNLFGMEGQIGFVETAAGFFAWAETITNPVGVRLYAGWVGLPFIKFPKAVGIASANL